jgi:hypothetical protein
MDYLLHTTIWKLAVVLWLFRLNFNPTHFSYYYLLLITLLYHTYNTTPHNTPHNTTPHTKKDRNQSINQLINRNVVKRTEES